MGQRPVSPSKYDTIPVTVLKWDASKKERKDVNSDVLLRKPDEMLHINIYVRWIG